MAIVPTVLQRVASAEPIDAWPDPIPLRDELPAVLPFHPDLLPSQLRAWVQDTAERMNRPLDLVAIPAMVAAGSLLGRRVGIRPQRHTSWQEAANLWGCVVARPGSLKSPAAPEALAPLRRLEVLAAEQHQVDLARHKAAEALYKIEREDVEKGARAALKDKAKADPRGNALNALSAIAEPQAPAERRYLTSDVTAEKLGEICAANPNGIMVHRDELLSLFSDLDQTEKHRRAACSWRAGAARMVIPSIASSAARFASPLSMSRSSAPPSRAASQVMCGTASSDKTMAWCNRGIG